MRREDVEMGRKKKRRQKLHREALSAPDLAPLMILAARAWRSRCEARAAVLAADLATAQARVEAAQRLHATDAGRRLERLIRWLRASCPWSMLEITDS
jgi:hypothetical protein